MKSRRQSVDAIPPARTYHAGLWLDKFIPFQLRQGEQPPEGHGEPRAELVAQVADIATPDAYSEFYLRWVTSLQLAGVPENQMHKASVQGRLSVGLGGEAVLETAITLHRTYGVPYIPGSAIKGLAARYAHKHLEGDSWRKGGEAHTIMFGNTKSAGYLIFFDALYVPDIGHNDKVLWPDVITVHHPKYYQGNEPPADWDGPIPVPFLSATGDYLIAIGGDAAWANKAFEILSLALLEEGIGAKTSTGYGRMTIQGMATVAPTAPSGLETSVSITPSVPMILHRGVIIEIQPPKHFGRVRDSETGEEYRFSTDVIEGDFPAKKAIAEFTLQDGRVVRVRRV